MFETTARQLAAILALTIYNPLVSSATEGPVVETTRGPVAGINKGKVTEYLGIPYAAPPVGELRWQPPTEHAPWKKPLDATKFGPTCAQITELALFAGPANNNEDCLYLNVFRPEEAKGQKLPVMVWIYGGAFVDGESNDYDGSKLATMGRLIIVSINYRLNLMGFLAHPALDREGHPFGNYALLDQQAALRWVRDNISRFGGDPGNVTIGGQSAGGTSAGLQMISPLAKGLFHRAIIESGASYLAVTPLKVAEEKGVAFAVAAGCGAGDDAATAACLRRLPASTIEKLSGTTSSFGPYITFGVVDGQIVPSGAASAFASGEFTHVPVMNGSSQDEGNFFIALQEYFSGPPRTAISDADVTRYVNQVFKGNAGPGGMPPSYPAGTPARILQHYSQDGYASPQLRLDAIETDAMVCRIQHANHLLAGKVPLYAYEFRDRTAPSFMPEMPGFSPLAYHTSDIQYLFAGWHGSDKGVRHVLSSQQRKLSDELIAAWSNFAWTGNPNRQGDDPWPSYGTDARSGAYLSEDVPSLSTFRDDSFTRAHSCDFWEDLLVYN